MMPAIFCWACLAAVAWWFLRLGRFQNSRIENKPGEVGMTQDEHLESV